MTEPGQFAVHTSVSPAGVLPRQPEHQVADLPTGLTAARPILVRPAPFDQATVPGQQRARCHQPMRTQRRRQQPGQSGQDRPIGPIRRWAGDLAPQHRHLVPQHHDLRVLGRLATRQQHQPSEHPDHDQMKETYRHSPRSCPHPTVHPKPQVSTAATSSEAVHGRGAHPDPELAQLPADPDAAPARFSLAMRSTSATTSADQAGASSGRSTCVARVRGASAAASTVSPETMSTGPWAGVGWRAQAGLGRGW
jgi:hypothetical protein